MVDHGAGGAMRPCGPSSPLFVRDCWLIHPASGHGEGAEVPLACVLGSASQTSLLGQVWASPPGLIKAGQSLRSGGRRTGKSPTFVFDPQNTGDGLWITWDL